ncbi:cysteine dioxygenase family protein [Oscillatoria sp. FACHB-1407]|uniref:cysteine dioxygenase n=1 Tax=Oscillatoria sp. FACHB-1407 TaxID=2692847 RepID=UPI0016890BA2|nr:cysteine dioxygenase family protein [Oscillatoria sp. FACHB-1407]MBD2460551.1 cysteine dioxygenase family protein [Oscillatoria sp. FACHB-1407]
MNLVRTRLDIEDFILETMRSPIDRLQLSQLQTWVADLDLKDDLFQQHIAFCNQGYRRTLVCRTSRFDMLILCWKPGQSSTIHDHADSLNVTRVYRGELTSRLFEQVDSPQGRCCPDLSVAAVRLQREERLQRNALATVDRHQIHQLANTSDENLVTLHIYARPLKTIQIYCPQSGHVNQMPVQYDLAA